MKYKHLFGPVVSRRLGISLGLDIIPYKHCSLNCVYCEVSRTTHLTMKRKPFYDVEEITAELDIFLAAGPQLDYITFSGAGEPTLNSNLGEIILYIKQHYPQYKLALITNSTLLDDEELISEILPCDLILPSLDAASDEVFEQVNRPCDKLETRNVINGLIKLRNAYQGQIWLEIFVVPGINDHLEEIELLKEAVIQIRPDRVQLNSLDRPGAEDWVVPALYLNLEEIRTIMQEGCDIPIEIIAKVHKDSLITVSEENVLPELIELIRTDEYSKQELAKELGIHVNEVSKLLQHLILQGKIIARRNHKGVFYIWKD